MPSATHPNPRSPCLPSADSLGRIVARSDMLRNVTNTYGWSTAERSLLVESISATLSTLADWRLDNIRSLDRQYTLGLDCGQGGAILDAGCGSGSLTIAARRSGTNIVGIEPDRACLALARELAIAIGIAKRNLSSLFTRGDATELPFPDGHFSMITCHQVIEHTCDVHAVLREFRRCLAPGGLLWLDAPDYRFCFEPHYRIPWLPLMDMKVAPLWLEIFEKPITGLGTFRYVALPQCVDVLQRLGMEILTASTTRPLECIQQELRNLLGEDIKRYPDCDVDDITALALRAKQSGFQPPPTSFLILARRPVHHRCYV